MQSQDKFGLPLDLGDGLVLRWAQPEDAEAVAQFNLGIHSDPADPEIGLYHWTLDLFRGDHPTTKASDFTVVVDNKNGGRIVSSLNLISQTWTYDGIPFGVGRPELVGTLPEYRRHGLVRRQMEIVHALSADRGELAMAITGIPWYYRQFGYEMTLNLGGQRDFYWARKGNSGKADDEPYRVRAATAEDIPVLMELYRAHVGQSVVVRARSEANWYYEMITAHPEAFSSLQAHMIETLDGRVVAYATWRPWNTLIGVREFGVLPGHSWRSVGRFVTRHLEQEARILNQSRPHEKQLTGIGFNLGEVHPLYNALDPELERASRPYAWYVRVPDLPAFLRHIAPVLESRLSGSVMAGYSGTIKINLYRRRFTLVWADGRLVEVGEGYDYDNLEDGDALFPELTFLQLLFCYRSIDELTLSYTDLYTQNNDALVLLRALFPRRSSRPIPME